jgi:hypothetical protein
VESLPDDLFRLIHDVMDNRGGWFDVVDVRAGLAAPERHEVKIANKLRRC